MSAAQKAHTADTLTVQEAMEILGVSRMTIFRLKNKGKLRPVIQPTLAKPHPRLLFRREDLARLERHPDAQAS